MPRPDPERRPNPRYFGPGRGVTYLNFLSDGLFRLLGAQVRTATACGAPSPSVRQRSWAAPAALRAPSSGGSCHPRRHHGPWYWWARLFNCRGFFAESSSRVTVGGLRWRTGSRCLRPEPPAWRW